ncbi:hypothetical protein GCM10023215_26110 [Pseudonocardia yuanmonensis]|uniref:Uncharacterized protein n=1 Tax=Pseudonocardia yuanmonensis TaxID=1095914 RepID=A0ABP8WHB6_9PSEU
MSAGAVDEAVDGAGAASASGVTGVALSSVDPAAVPVSVPVSAPLVSGGDPTSSVLGSSLVLGGDESVMPSLRTPAGPAARRPWEIAVR